MKAEGCDWLVFACICDEVALLFICRMDDNSRFKLEIRIVAPNCRGRWYNLEKIVDADFTNFRDLALLWPLLHQEWSGHTMRQWLMLHTRKGRENHLHHHQVPRKGRIQQPLLQQVLLAGMVLFCSHFSILCDLQLTDRHFLLSHKIWNWI